MYLDHANLSIGMAGEVMSMTVPQLYCQLSGEYDGDNTWDDADLIYNRVFFNYRTPRAEAQQWMVHIVANIAGVAINSIWPWLPACAAGDPFAVMKRAVYNRTIYPTIAKPVTWNGERATIAIMWCHNAKRDSEPNHFVPVVP